MSMYTEKTWPKKASSKPLQNRYKIWTQYGQRFLINLVQ